MAGDIKPFGELKGYQFWALVGILVILTPRILVGADIPMDLFAAKLFEIGQYDVLINDVIGVGLVATSYFDYRDFLN